MKFDEKRIYMVENQLRPNKITNNKILSSFLDIEKEFFINDNQKDITYSDLDIIIINKRGYLKNLHIAQLIQFSKINNNHKILHIGALTGYVTYILSKLCSEVVAVENDEKLFSKLKNNIKDLNISNVIIIKDELNKGYENKSPYDIIFIDCPIYRIPSKLLSQLNPQLGKLIYIKKITDNFGKGTLLTKNKENYNKEILFDAFSNLELYKDDDEFIF